MTARDLLPEQSPEQMRRESTGLREMAVMLGRDEHWDNPSILLEAVALIVTRSGLPNPGDARNSGAYADYYQSEHYALEAVS